MNYKFPEIRTIDDVLPHVKDREEFIVAEREFGTVINYMVSMPDTFAMNGPDDLGGAIRRECRGIIFGRDGIIMSRPFHKFFNVGERDETQVSAIDITQPHVIMEKMDGSMIRPILLDGKLRLGTKMGITDVAFQAEEWINQEGNLFKLRRVYLDFVVTIGKVTPLFEWVAPENRIILDYAEADLVYLGARDNVTGEYMFDPGAPFTQVPRYGSFVLRPVIC